MRRVLRAARGGLAPGAPGARGGLARGVLLLSVLAGCGSVLVRGGSVLARGGGALARVAARWAAGRERLAAGGADRGDVPGWVMVTVMTAALVVAIATLATPALQSLFSSAIDQVTGIGGGG